MPRRHGAAEFHLAWPAPPVRSTGPASAQGAPAPGPSPSAPHAGECHRSPRATEERRIAQRRIALPHAFAGRQPKPDIGPHFRRHPVPTVLREFRSARATISRNSAKRRDFLAAGSQFARCRAVLHRASRPGRRPRATPKLPDLGVSLPYRFLLSMYRRNLVRALAICDRTVAFEQFSMLRDFFRRQAFHVAQQQRLPLSRAQQAQAVFQIFAMLDRAAAPARDFPRGFRGASSISQNVARPLRRRKSIAVLVAILDSQCAAFCSSLSCSWCCSALMKASWVRS